MTGIAAPRGLGKSLSAMALAVALATGGQFRGQQVRSVKVLLLDRDNPDSIVKRRLRAWGAAWAPNLRVLTRQDAPDLRDKAAWSTFPVREYEALIVDSVGAATEGVTEKEGKQTTEILATLLDVARQGVAILLLMNCTKDALNVKGRGEWADRLDILFEVRDATNFTPSGKKPWWQELPAAGEAAWAERATRRKKRIDFRLAFIASKFRLGPEPEPFCIELYLPEGEPWTLRDVTVDLLKAGEDAHTQQAKAKEEQVGKATEALAQVVKDRAATEESVLKTEAEEFLCREQHLSHKKAREVIADNEGIRREIRKLEGQRGHPQALFPLSQNDERRKSSPSGNPQESGGAEEGISDDPMKSGVGNDSAPQGASNGASEDNLFPTLRKSGVSEMGAQKTASNGTCGGIPISDAEEVEEHEEGEL